MTAAAWVSANGVRLRDLVPSERRRGWAGSGFYPDRDLFALFSHHAQANPGRAAVIDPRGTVDYATLDRAARRIAAGLAAAGLGTRDIIGVQVPGGRDAVAAELAVAAIGAVCLSFPCGRGVRDTLSLLGRSRASAAVVAATAGPLPLAENLRELRPQLPHLRAAVVLGAPEPPTVRWPVPGGSPGGWIAIDPWLPEPVAWDDARPVDPDGPARILVTSGSETEPKMIVYSHNAMAGGRAAYVRALRRGADPMRNLVLVPLSSSYGSLGTSVTVAALGATLIMLDGFDPAGALRAITTHRPTHVFAVPTMLRRMLDLPPEPGEDTSCLHAVVSSSDVLCETTAARCVRRFGCDVINVYGSADGVNCHTAATGIAAATGNGLPDPAVADLHILGADGRPAPGGQPGEICALGPMTPMCYVQAPELDVRYRLPDGAVRTGDRGRLDAAGRLHVLGRLRQIVVRGGHNISPAEVESQLGRHPAVADVACVGVPDADLGERLCACVAVRPGAAAPALRELNDFLERDRGLERRKLPELLVLLPELPLGATGKLCRHTLAALAAERAGRVAAFDVAATDPVRAAPGGDRP
jgi:acyl-CoA synthetase (AMP-forming)/AMP-acid ligase II